MLFMPYRCPVGAGPSSNTWPRWASQFAHTTSVRAMPRLVSRRSSTAPGVTGWKNEGHPQPASNFVSETKRSCPQHTQP
mgnify:CR=1 FL=1